MALVAGAGTGCTATTVGLRDQPAENMATLDGPSKLFSGSDYRVEAIDGQRLIGSMLVRFQLLPSDHVVTVARGGDLPGGPERVDLALHALAGGSYQLRTGPVAGEPASPPVAIYDIHTGQAVSHAVSH